ncbi:15212_t:CDS:1, partial [Acaulospora morrowiae]
MSNCNIESATNFGKNFCNKFFAIITLKNSGWFKNIEDVFNKMHCN